MDGKNGRRKMKEGRKKNLIQCITFNLQTGFSLFAPVLVCTTEALDDLNKNREDKPFSIDRFRANIIVSGTAVHDEV